MQAVKSLIHLWADASATSAVEYALMVSLIGAGLVAAVMGLGSQVGAHLNDAATVLKG